MSKFKDEESAQLAEKNEAIIWACRLRDAVLDWLGKVYRISPAMPKAGARRQADDMLAEDFDVAACEVAEFIAAIIERELVDMRLRLAREEATNRRRAI
jgi:hypothetical protein